MLTIQILYKRCDITVDLGNSNDFIQTIYPYLKAMGAFGSTMSFGQKLFKTTFGYIKGLSKRNFYDINEIFDQIENENINLGNIIETSGYLFKYGQVFKPYTHVNYMFGNCKKEAKEKIVYKNGQKLIQASMSMNPKAFEPPIQKIPSFNDVGCAFLYDSRFKGFMHELNQNVNEQSEKPLIIDCFSKPIMVLYDKTKQERFINKEVNLKGRIIQLPLELTGALNGIFDNTIRDICSNFFRPYNENVNFICISLLESECEAKEISAIVGIDSIEAPLYIEAQAEGLSKLPSIEAQKLIESILPNLPQKLDPNFPLTVGTYTNNVGTPFLSIDNINVVFREPEIVGFYCDTILFDSEEYQKNLNDFIIFVNNFAIDYQKISKNLIGEKGDLSLNFIFDYEKQFLFDKRGVLNSRTAKRLYEFDEPTRYVQNWLKQK